MITYFKMKRNEWKVKAQVYGIIAAVMDSQKDMIAFAKKLYAALKDVPTEELKSELISNLASLIHEENRKNEDE